MAEAESEPKKEKFPPEVVPSDNDPSSGYFKLTITIPNLNVERKLKGLKKVPVVTNGSCEVIINELEISVKAEVIVGEKTTSYAYCKKLPEDLKLREKKSDYDLKYNKDTKECKVILNLAKCKKDVSLGAYEKFFQKKTETSE